MVTVPLSHLLFTAVVLFALGMGGVVLRKNLLFILISIEIMLNAGGLAFVAVGASHHTADGQVMFMFILTMAAAEVSIGLALLVELSRRNRSVDADRVGGRPA